MTAQEIAHEYILLGTGEIEEPFRCESIVEARSFLKSHNQRHHRQARLARRLVTDWKVIEDGVLSTQSS